MEVGNEKTLWNEECEAQCEHGYLNRMGDQLLLKGIDSNEALDIQTILASYQIEGRKQGWKCYGVKITHALQSGAWEVFQRAFETRWGSDVQYIVTVRHPFGIIKSTVGDERWNPKKIYDSVLSCQGAIEWLLGNRATILVGYPNTWITGGIQTLVEAHLGLKWCDEADLYDPQRQKTFNENELIDMSNIYPALKKAEHHEQ